MKSLCSSAPAPRPSTSVPTMAIHAMVFSPQPESYSSSRRQRRRSSRRLETIWRSWRPMLACTSVAISEMVALCTAEGPALTPERRRNMRRAPLRLPKLPWDDSSVAEEVSRLQMRSQ
eukprot:scaffold9647_cov107-Isochrysis_galbana.AAC.4